MVARLARLADLQQATIVFDKGNNSKANFARIDQLQLHYVGSLPPFQHTDLLNLPLSEFVDLKGRRLAG